MPEVGRAEVEGWIGAAERLVCCRIGFTEVFRAVMLQVAVDSGAVLARLDRDWSRVVVVDVDDTLARSAGRLAVAHHLRSLDALHLAAAESIHDEQLRLATFDDRMRRAALALGIPVLPE